MPQDINMTIRRGAHRVIARLVGLVLRPGALYDARNFRLWENRGYHITPLHFYSPLPDTRDLEARDWALSDCAGIDLRPQAQLRLLEAFSAFSSEYDALATEPGDRDEFYLGNDAFCGIDPHVYHSMIRYFRPRQILEIGSGYSTVLGARACRLNRTTSYVCVDPWPREFVADGVTGVDLIRQRVEELDVNLLLQLQENDILFVDSSHVVRTGGDVSFLILEVLPRLSRGVIVHFHDIFLPFDYPKEWIVQRHRFWTEQYLLQAYLADNRKVEVLFASHFMSLTHPRPLRRAFPKALWLGGGSFWIRKC
jgi:hypothetical protein